MPNEIDDEVIERVLAGTPDRIVDAILGPHARADGDATRDALAAMGAALVPVVPPRDLRGKIADAIAAREQHVPRKAVLVIDMIEDYLTPGRPLFIPRARAVMDAVRARVEAARRDGHPVIWVCDYHRADDPDLESLPIHAQDGTTGWHPMPELGRRPDEPIVKHRTFSGFFETDLEARLRDLRVNHLVLTGCATEVQIMTTGTDALMRGFHVEVPRDSQAGTTETAEQVSLAVLKTLQPLMPMPGPPSTSG